MECVKPVLYFEDGEFKFDGSPGQEEGGRLDLIAKVDSEGEVSLRDKDAVNAFISRAKAENGDKLSFLIKEFEGSASIPNRCYSLEITVKDLEELQGTEGKQLEFSEVNMVDIKKEKDPSAIVSKEDAVALSSPKKLLAKNIASVLIGAIGGVFAGVSGVYVGLFALTGPVGWAVVAVSSLVAAICMSFVCYNAVKAVINYRMRKLGRDGSNQTLIASASKEAPDQVVSTIQAPDQAPDQAPYQAQAPGL